jgi:hypothetical protein
VEDNDDAVQYAIEATKSNYAPAYHFLGDSEKAKLNGYTEAFGDVEYRRNWMIQLIENL